MIITKALYLCYNYEVLQLELSRGIIQKLFCFTFQEGRSPLHYADALQGTTGGVNQLQQYLVDHGADISVVDAVRSESRRAMVNHINV